MSIIDCYAKKDEVTIHYLDSTNDDPNLTPFVYIPGALGFAEQFQEEMKYFSPRRSIALSLRGMGKSDAPQTGYTLEEHVSDIQSVVEKSNVKDYCMMAYSMGVPYALSFVVRNSEQIKGLIICDYPAKYPSIPQTWVDGIISKGILGTERSHVIQEIQRDSVETYLWKELSSLLCPVLILKGGTEHALLQMEDVEQYKHHLKNVSVVEFSDSGHELWVPDYDRFIHTIKEFLLVLDEM
ncbi:alpha/beta fold hydrolase [Pseudogracilibacillus auburnensis]|uniref:alpha/beta fold hydrolase n=1 Tax=Pseudogracilibacillus auburnensis TaxID=1494959 RepID=UPI001A96C242|nr:alpha/beta hydrolase [Pseudogracilibacillus auburnensis]MBO1001330.1 alpha/beta hydrolase [Pseudogracilibacillus auburnensis]